MCDLLAKCETYWQGLWSTVGLCGLLSGCVAFWWNGGPTCIAHDLFTEFVTYSQSIWLSGWLQSRGMLGFLVGFLVYCQGT